MQKQDQDGLELFETFQHATDREAKAQGAVLTAKHNLSEAKQSFIRWLMPADCRLHETLRFWTGKELIEVKIISIAPPDGSITIYKMGRELKA